MRILIFSLIMMISSLGVTNPCADNCSHAQKKEISQNSEHDCCKGVESPAKSENQHSCSTTECVSSTVPFKNSVIKVENQYKQKDIEAPSAIVNGQFLLAHLSSKNRPMEPLYATSLRAKLPLYLFYKKLRLP